MPKAYTRLLSRLPPDTAALWREVEPLVQLTYGLLVVDDTTLDKPHVHKMRLVRRHWSGKHHTVVSGINGATAPGLTTLLWTDGLSSLPCDCRLYEPAEEGKVQVTKNGHFLTRLKSNHQVDPDDMGNVAVEDVAIPAHGRRVHLKGFVEVFRIVAPAAAWNTRPGVTSE